VRGQNSVIYFSQQRNDCDLLFVGAVRDSLSLAEQKDKNYSRTPMTKRLATTIVAARK
jgi:hypothetical protein